GRGRDDAPALENPAELLKRAVGAHAGGIFRELEGGADVGVAPAVDKAEQDDLAVGFGQFVDRRIQRGGEAAPIGAGGGGSVWFGHSLGLLFAVFAALLSPDRIGGLGLGGGIEPAGEKGVAGEGGRLAG